VTHTQFAILKISINYTLKIDLIVEGILTNINATIPIITEIQFIGEYNQLPLITYPNPTDDTNICDDRERMNIV
jgi:hypothetical protein